MKLRDQIAIAAMNALIAKHLKRRATLEENVWHEIASGAYVYADAMLRARRKRLVWVTDVFHYIQASISEKHK